MQFFRRSVSGARWLTLHEKRDGLLGFVTPRSPDWNWQSDLRKLRLAEQLQGTSPTLDEALLDFKAAYTVWRARVTDDEFDRVYRRSAGR